MLRAMEGSERRNHISADGAMKAKGRRSTMAHSYHTLRLQHPPDAQPMETLHVSRSERRACTFCVLYSGQKSLREIE